MISFETYMLSTGLTKEALTKAKQYVDEKVELGFEIVIIHEFPEEPDKNTIYLKSSEDLEGSFDEWIYILGEESQWNKIGTTGVDFTNYYTKNEVDAKIAAEGGEVFPTEQTQVGTYNGKAVYKKMLEYTKVLLRQRLELLRILILQTVHI